jgi:predicted aspartyl protease
MTIREALLEVVFFDVPGTAIDKALIDAGLTGTDNYDTVTAQDIDLAALPLLRRLVIQADITEGGYSVKYDRNAILKLIASLESSNGIFDAGNAVRGVNVW